eukprot:6212079-Pleurochrysis_carterae.AAC.1
MILEKLWGKRSTGPGCASPWDFEAILHAAMETLTGQTEFAWNWGNFDWVSWAMSFKSVAADFGDQSKMRLWQYEFDEQLVQHGCVLVRYRRNLLPPKDGEPEFLPADRVDGKWVPKPEGLLFMVHGSFPDISIAPDLETWKPAETSAAEGLGVNAASEQQASSSDAKRNKPWKSQKVFSDILGHSMLSFSSDQRDQWRALHHFHMMYATCDSMPNLPVLCTPPPSEAENPSSSWSMEHGTPISWADAWRKLAWRYPRPHQPQQGGAQFAPAAAQEAATTAADNSETRHESGAAAARPVRARAVDAAIYNGVTGLNNPKRVKKKAVQAQQRDTCIDSSGVSRESVNVGELVFVGVPDCFEGELAVGLGRVVAPASSEGEVMVEWLQRVGVSCDPLHRGYAWTGSPRFVALLDANTRRVQQNLQPLTDVLPCPVRLTTKSEQRYQPDKSLAHRKQEIR